MRKLLLNRWLLIPAILLLAFSCGDDGGESGNPVASFQFAADEGDFLTINFTNFSKNADEYSWNFGDGDTSDEENPSHTYDAGGTYSVVLTVTGNGKTATQTKSVTIISPDEAQALLAGETSKTWKLFREGVSMSVGPNAENPAGHWPGLTNNGARPCLYLQEFTFERDGDYIFDDNGKFWAEYGLFNNVSGCDQNTPEGCIDATAANMKNACGVDVSAWLSDTHSYTYNSTTGELTLSGTGAWIGIPKLGTTGETLVPVDEVKAKISITQHIGYDVLKVEFIYAANYWPIYYVHYTDATLEPALVTDTPVFGEDLPNITPTALGHTFESTTSFDALGAIAATGSLITTGENDPTNAAATKVGRFERVATDYQEAQIRTSPDLRDIDFSNFETVSLDVYLPSSNNYTTTLTKKVIIGFGDQSQTEQWWTGLTQYESAELTLDTWHTVTFQLNAPNVGTSVLERDDFDMVFIQFGGSAHSVPGTFYVRNLKFE